MKLNKAISALLLTLSLSSVHTAQADTVLGLFVGGGTWQSKPSGSFNAGDNINLGDFLSLDSTSSTYIFAALEHPLPFIPSVKLSMTDYADDVTTTFSQSKTFKSTTYTAGSSVNTQIDLNFTDLTLYYEVLDNWVSLDLGLTARQFNGSITLASGSTTSSTDITGTYPLAYVKAQFDLPLTGLFAGAEANALSLREKAKSNDISLYLGYEAEMGLGAIAGYRQISYSFDDLNALNSDIDIAGPYLSIYFHL